MSHKKPHPRFVPFPRSELLRLIAAARQALTDRAELERLKAQTTWRPVETAPKDGRVLLLYGVQLKRRIFGSGYWFQGVPGDGEGWIAQAFHTQPSDDMRGSFTPTHWMPLPSPPSPTPEDR